MSRDVTIRATYDSLVGDETYELWLKPPAETWFLYATGLVDPDMDAQQEFVLSTLAEDSEYIVQLRTKRSGRYRAGWLTSNPDTWPSSSRLDFTTGALTGVGAPELVSAIWSRTASTHTQIELTINADDTTKDLKVFRNGVAIHTIAAPHVNPVIYDDLDLALGENFTYEVKHTVGFLDGPPSVARTVFSGPLPIAGFAQTSAFDHYGTYDLGWTDDSRTYQVEDDYLCVGTTFAFVTGGLVGFASEPQTVTKEGSPLPAGATQEIAFHARARAKVTSFGVDDFSDWTSLLIQMTIDDPDDDTNYNTCP